jgi:3-phosphoshikimate 1-carboxyvinyltransferase
VWRDILMSNREELLKQSLRFRHTLDAMEHVIKTGNVEALEDLIRGASDARSGWQMNAPSRRPIADAGPRAHCPPHVHDAFLDLPPLLRAGGTVRLPGSKSISNRVLLLAGLASGTTVVHDLLDSDDTRVMLAALRELGCDVDERGDELRITGLGGRLKNRDAKLFLGNAGTAMRPLTAALAVLTATQGGRFELAACRACTSGPSATSSTRCASSAAASTTSARRLPAAAPDGRLGQRAHRGADPRARRRVQPVPHRAAARPAAGDATAPVVVEVEGELISKPYVEITLNLLARFGIDVERDGWQRFTIPQGAPTVAGRDPRRRRRVVGLVLRRAGRHRRDRGAGAHRRRRARLDPGRHPLRRRGARDGRRRAGRPGWLEVRRGRWPLRRSTSTATTSPTPR